MSTNNFPSLSLWFINKSGLKKNFARGSQTLFICNKSNSNLIFKFQKSFINFLIYGLLRGFRILSLTLISVNYFSEVLFIEFNLVSFRSLRLNFIIILDLLSLLFLSAVRVITLAVLKFSESYINNDKNFFRFHLLLLLFVFRMYFLILSPNLIRLLLGWDGLGLRSYLLVIYYDRPKAYNSGIITVLTNRFGDALILIRIGCLVAFGNWNLYFYRSRQIFYSLGIFLILAACTKSAQIPFSAWLPAAMAAPTPVSALVHSSTLVTAGVYILIRHADLFCLNSFSIFLIIVGTLTIIMASLRALFESDLKKIVALSTLSQLGLIVLRLGLGAFFARFFHLLRHAFFKALLFLAAGAVIHASEDYQDLRLIGRSSFSLPVINRFTLISIFRLIGLPFMSAFFSKELILDIIILFNLNALLYYIIILGVGLTAIYRRRFIAFIFRRPSHNTLLVLKLDENLIIVKRIMILTLPATIGGFILNYILQVSIKIRSAPRLIKLIILLILGVSRYWRFSRGFLILSTKWSSRKWILGNMWALPLIRGTVPTKLNSFPRSLIPKIFDRGIIRVPMTLLNNYLNFIAQTFSSFNYVYKILRLALIWAMLVVYYYLCNIYNK